MKHARDEDLASVCTHMDLTQVLLARVRQRASVARRRVWISTDAVGAPGPIREPCGEGRLWRCR